MLERNKLRNKRILVPGSAGSLGRELVRQLAPYNTIFCFDSNEVANYDLIEDMRLKHFNVTGRTGDIRDKWVLRSALAVFQPEIVVNCAALKVVTPGEQNPEEHIKTNVSGTWNLIEAAKQAKVKRFIQVSSDKAVNPTSIYGTTKLLGELLAKNAGYTIVRFGNCMSSRGSIFPLWQSQIDRGEQITVTDERMERYFLSIPDAVKLLIRAIDLNPATIIFDMGKPVRIIELAENLVEKLQRDQNKKVSIKMIGIRPGESLKENLMTDSERKRAIRNGKFYIIPH